MGVGECWSMLAAVGRMDNLADLAEISDISSGCMGVFLKVGGCAGG